MIKGKLLLLAGVLSVLPMTDLSAQNQRVKSDQEDSYVIVTFVRSRKHVKMKTIYHWIMSADPNSDEIYPISFAPPIYLDSLNTPYAKGALMTIAYKDNMNKEKAYILQFLNYPKKQSIPLLPGNAGYDFNGYILPHDEEDLLSKPGFVSDLVQCTKQHMKKVQVIRKKWKYSSLGKNLEDTSRHQETIKVYLTPVKGPFSLGWEFCYTFKSIEFAGYAYYPTGKVYYDESFWDKPESDVFKYRDYEHVDYAAFTSYWLTTADNVKAANVYNATPYSKANAID